jgi:aminocarboxymuconate-semialdehyde decarboxylase
MNIDVHAHFLPPECIELRTEAPSGGLAANEREDMSDLAQRVVNMRERNIDVQLLSVAPGLAHPDAAWARRLNDATASAIAPYGGRFVGLATVPLDDPEDAARELESAVKERDFRGLEVLTNYKGENLDSPRYTPLFKKMVELDVAALIHPSNVMGRRERLKSYFLANLIGNPTDTAVAAASMIFGVLREMPRLSHGGGTCPVLAGRWDHAWEMGLVEQTVIDRPPTGYMKQFYFDSITHSPEALASLIRTYGAASVMLGSDYPTGMGDFTPAEAISRLADLTDDEKQMIYSKNAARVFGLS